MSITAAFGTAAAGMEAAADRFAQSASRVARAGTGLPAADDDPAQGIIDGMVAKQAFGANVGVVRTADEMMGTLLDVIA